MNCDAIFKATKVDGVYDKDPLNFKNAKLIKKIKYDDVLNKNIKIMDATSITLAKESKIPIIVTSLKKENALIEAIKGYGNFSIIS